MTQVKCFWSLLTGTHRYTETLSMRGRGRGGIIEVPILACLIETANGRILCDVGCDYQKIVDPAIRKLKALAADMGAEFWPNHDTAFYHSLRPLPNFYE